MSSKNSRTFVAFEEMTAKELWEHNRLEYASVNPIVRVLYDAFYHQIENIITSIANPKDHVLEVGCGCAESSLRIHAMLQKADPSIQFEASEFDERFVEVIGTLNYPFAVMQESVYEMKRADDSIEHVFFLEVLEHLEHPELAVSELFRVAQKHVIISVPNEPIWRMANMARGKYLGQWGNTPGHINHYNETELRKLISPYGRVVKMYKPFPWLMMLCEKR
jgi:2-polyprenyl-3-methyl-5-hydroxy-6-metoxy-1,4-benzoquinol methylase